jgi:hypothetical protein
MVRAADSPQHPIKRNFYNPADVDVYLATMITDTLASMNPNATCRSLAAVISVPAGFGTTLSFSLSILWNSPGPNGAVK